MLNITDLGWHLSFVHKSDFLGVQRQNKVTRGHQVLLNHSLDAHFYVLILSYF